MKIALYKGTRPGLAGLYNMAIRLVTMQQYSHAELVFSDGMSGSSSFEDGGVRVKKINYTTQSNWDFIDLNVTHDEQRAKVWFAEHFGQPYDLPGVLRFMLPFVPEDPNAWFCSEAIAAALGIVDPKPSRLDPGKLASLPWRRA